jgi:hypothetical protein
MKKYFRKPVEETFLVKITEGYMGFPAPGWPPALNFLR